jgi:hypothetical protein
MVSRFENKRQPIIEAELDDAIHGSLKRKTILLAKKKHIGAYFFQSGVYQ